MSVQHAGDIDELTEKRNYWKESAREWDELAKAYPEGNPLRTVCHSRARSARRMAQRYSAAIEERENR